jgi:drug/metabolite transporter (DMT)-like permease
MSPVANVLVTMSIGPLLTALLARFAIGHRLPLRTWVAIGVAGIGIAVMYGTQLTSAGSSTELLGTLVALCVPLAGAVNWTVVQRSHGQGQDVDLVPSVLVGAVLSSLVTLPLALPFQATPHDLGLLAMLGSVQLAIPCVLSVWCARVLKAPEVSLLQLLEVLFGITLAWLGANEAPGTAVLLGGTLVLGALVVNEALGWWQRRAVV